MAAGKDAGTLVFVGSRKPQTLSAARKAGPPACASSYVTGVELNVDGGLGQVKGSEVGRAQRPYP
jgi:hypothetical protein